MPFVIAGPNLIVCEGAHDKEFFRAMVAHIGRVADFQIADPGDILGGGGGGNTKWPLVLSTLVGAPDFHLINGLIIVGDNDDDPAANIRRIKAAVRNAPIYLGPPRRTLRVPRTPMARGAGVPAIAIIPIPSRGRVGTLETLCNQAIQVTANTIACADNFIRCNRIRQRFGVSKHAKVRFRALVAPSHRRNPDISLKNMWKPRRYGGNPALVPVNHAAFQPIANFLSAF